MTERKKWKKKKKLCGELKITFIKIRLLRSNTRGWKIGNIRMNLSEFLGQNRCEL